MSRRIPISKFGTAIVSHYYRVLTIDLFGPLRAWMQNGGKPQVFHSQPLAFIFGQKETGLALSKGHFNYAGQRLDVGAQGDPWTVAVPSERFAAWLHGFGWLSDLSKSGDKQALLRGRELVDSWIANYGKFNNFSWDSNILTDRLFHWLAFWSPLLTADNMSEAAQVRRQSVLRQLKYLRSIYKRTQPGLYRLRAAATLVLGGMRLKDKEADRFLSQGLDWLDDEIEAQILPDGGHISRSPEQSLQALETLIIIDSLLQKRGVEGSKSMSRAIDRLTPVIKFFTGADGRLANFNGAGENDKAHLKAVLKATQKLRKSAPAKAFGYCPHSGFQRIEQDGTVLLLDAGGSPQRPYDSEAHLGPLAFELSTKLGRLIVNCGWSDEQSLRFRQVVRTTAAHSTLTLNNKDAGGLVNTGWKTRILGPAISADAGPVNASRKEQARGTWLEASHDGYRESTGLSHKRRFFMSDDGNDLRGEDSLAVPLGATPISRDEIPFDIRFHLHPDVRVSLSQDQQSALLIQNGKAGWRFRTDGGPLSIESSIYLGRGTVPMKSQQIVISGRAFCDGDGTTKSNRVRWSFKKLESARG